MFVSLRDDICVCVCVCMCMCATQDPDAPIEEMDESMTRQFQLLHQCLVDDCPLVREAATRGVIALINNYWELIPLPAIAVFIQKLTSECTHMHS